MSDSSLKRDLIRGIKTNDTSRVKSLLRSPSVTVEQVDCVLERDGSYAVHLAAYCGHDAALLALLEFGCSPNRLNQNGESALHVACEQRFPHVVELLVDAAGVQLDLQRRLDRRTPLHVAAYHGCAESLLILLQAAANPDVKDRDGCTALFLAVQQNKHQAAKELLTAGANAKLKNNGLQTPLSYAMKQSQDKAMIKLLVETKQQSAAAAATSSPKRVQQQQQQQQQQRHHSLNRPQQQQQQQPQRLMRVQSRRVLQPQPNHAAAATFLTELRPQAAVAVGGSRVQSKLQQQLQQQQQQQLQQQIQQQLQQQQQQHQQQQQQQSNSRKLLKSAGVQVDNSPASASDADGDDVDEDDENQYKMTSKIKGLCIIINNQDYFNDDDFKERAGTDNDEKRLEKLFKSLGFHVKIFKNLDAKDIYWNLSNYAKSDHTDFDCYICCILAHGTMGAIYGVDGKMQKLADLTVMLSSTNCPSLAGKPKLFFIQACRGRAMQRGAYRPGAANRMENHHNHGHHHHHHHHDQDFDALNGTAEEYVLPDHGDFLIGYATVAQHIAQRHREQGSVYIQTLCDVLDRERHKEDLLSMLTKVKYRVSKQVFHNEDGSFFVQMPEVKETLRKKIYFR